MTIILNQVYTGYTLKFSNKKDMFDYCMRLYEKQPYNLKKPKEYYSIDDLYWKYFRDNQYVMYKGIKDYEKRI